MSNDDPAREIVIDDYSDLLKATRQTLELVGFAVSAHAVAKEALAALDKSFAGVVVSDIRMPEIDGLQLFDRVLQLDPDIP
ncbi:response regulator, partial [bacterium M00.F.Ca.ET.141.01.1.1]